MRTLFCLLFSIVLAAPIARAAGIQAEVGASYFALRNARPESASNVLTIDEPSEVAPFIAATYGVNERFGLRFSYHYVNNIRTTTQLGSPPGSMLPIVVWGHYHDDVHLLSAAPEFKWQLAPRFAVAIAPQLNWVASRGVVSYSTNDPAVLLIGPRKRNEDGFTLGGAVRLAWSLGNRAAVSVGYQWVDLEPSFDREAHVFSGGLQWKF